MLYCRFNKEGSSLSLTRGEPDGHSSVSADTGATKTVFQQRWILSLTSTGSVLEESFCDQLRRSLSLEGQGRKR